MDFLTHLKQMMCKLVYMLYWTYDMTLTGKIE